MIVYDNVNSCEEIKPFLPERGGEVIITSRMRYWPNSFEVLPIEVMSEQESLELLKSMIHRNENQESSEHELRELAKSLGHLPLALAQAGAYIHQTQMKISEYSGLFKKHETDMLINTAELSKEVRDKISITGTWFISLKQLIKESVEKQEPLIALNLLMVSAYLAPEKIPKELLLTWLKEAYSNLPNPELTLSNILGQLGHYSLIKMETSGDIRLHRLLQSVLRNQHKKGFKINENLYPALTVEWYNQVLNACRAYYLTKYKLKGEVLDKNYLAHLQSLEKHDKNIWPNSTTPEFGRLLRTIGAILSNSGDLKTGLIYYKEALKIAEHHPKNKIDLSICFNNIGANYYWLGDPKKARPYFEQGLTIAEEDPLCEKNQDFYPTQVSNVGQLHSYFGEFKQAKKLLERSRKLMIESYGSEHISLLWNSLWLGELYINLGEVKKALKLFNEALEICMKRNESYPESDLKMAYTLLSLGKAYQRVGDTKSAYKVLNNGIKMYKKIYGEEGHVFIGKFLSQLGNIYRDLKEPKKSKEILEQALSIQMKFYEGQEQCLDIMETKFGLGATYYELEDNKKAQELLEDVLKIQEVYYGKTHHNLGNTLLALSKVYKKLNQPITAQHYLERSQDIFRMNHQANLELFSPDL